MHKYDVFISHASEDHDAVAAPLAEQLQSNGLEVWFSDFELKLGDSIRRSIDQGILQARYGIVIFSPAFLSITKYWTQYELDGLVQCEVDGRKRLLPLWLNVTASMLRERAPSLVDRLAINWDQGIDNVVRQILKVVRPTPKSQRRAALERKFSDRLYEFQDAVSPALRLVGAGTEYFLNSDVSVLTKNEPYLIPEKYRSRRDELVTELVEEAKSRHKTIFDGPNVRMLSYRILYPDPTTERKALQISLSPLGYFDYAIARRLSDAALEDDGVDQIDEFVDIYRISNNGDLSVSSLSNIVDTATTVITRDGYILFVERSSQVNDRGGWHTCAVAENIQAAKDGVDFSSNAELIGLPFRTVKRGIAEELSPRLANFANSDGQEGYLRMLGMSYDLEGFHPDLLFLLILPLTHVEVRKICREFPGVDAPIEGALRSICLIGGAHDIVQRLATTLWTPGGAASVIRALEYMSSVASEKQLGSIQEVIDWMLSKGFRDVGGG